MSEACVDKRMAFNYRTRKRRRRQRRRRQRLIFQDVALSTYRRHLRHDVGYWVGDLEGGTEILRHMHSLVASLPRFPIRTLLPWPCEQTRKRRNNTVTWWHTRRGRDRDCVTVRPSPSGGLSGAGESVNRLSAIYFAEHRIKWHRTAARDSSRWFHLFHRPLFLLLGQLDATARC